MNLSYPVNSEELPSVDEAPVVDVVAVDPVDVTNVDVTKNGASSSASVSPGPNSDVLGSNRAELFRKNLMTPREDIEQDILNRATENLADAVFRI